MMTEKLIADARTARARKGYQNSLGQHLEREQARADMYDMLDFALEKDTKGARRIAAIQERVTAAQLAARRAGDPLNLTGHTKPTKPSKAERKATAKAERRQTETVVDADGIFRRVEVKGISLRGLDQHQIRAADDFERDWNAAFRGLSSRGFEPAVDGGGHGSREHLVRVEAQGRLRRLEAHLGDRDWIILKAVVLFGAGPAEAHRRGGPQHVIVSHEIKRVLNRVAGFYRPGARHRDAMLDACASIVMEMEREVSV